MKKLILSSLVFIGVLNVVCAIGKNALPEGGILYSRIGYDLNSEKHIIIRGSSTDFISMNSTFAISDTMGNKVLTGQINYWGKKWKSSWWRIDFSQLQKEGKYKCSVLSGKNEILKTGAFEVKDNLLWNKTWKTVSLQQLEGRIKLRNKNLKSLGFEYAQGGGWQDCGSYLREVNSHATMLVGLLDLLENAGDRVSKENIKDISDQVLIGTDYIAFCHDQGKALGKGEGAIIHEHPKHTTVITGDVAKGALVFARAGHILNKEYPRKSKEYKERAIRSFNWLDDNGPIHFPSGWDFNGLVQPNDGFDPIPYGAPEGFVRPQEWKTRDLVMMMWTALELFKSGKDEYKALAVKYARLIMKRQVEIDKPEGRFYGHFKAFKSVDFTEKAWEHHHMGFDAGSTFPHYLIPMIQMTKLLSDHPDALLWDKTIRRFAYGYFLPACMSNPFSLLPMGYFRGEGLLEFSGLWHGMNGAYGSAAALALELYQYTDDQQFKSIATSNLQWIAGLNAGIEEGNKYVSKSMIYGIGDEYIGSWTKIPGTICNGFESYKQFQFTKPRADDDGPWVFTDEGWITHSGGWLSALSRLSN